jgi:hypothetical protein
MRTRKNAAAFSALNGWTCSSNGMVNDMRNNVKLALYTRSILTHFGSSSGGE